MEMVIVYLTDFYRPKESHTSSFGQKISVRSVTLQQ